MISGGEPDRALSLDLYPQFQGMYIHTCTYMNITMGGAFRKKLVGQNAMSTDGKPDKQEFKYQSLRIR